MKLPFSYGFPMVFLWFSCGFPVVFLWFQARHVGAPPMEQSPMIDISWAAVWITEVQLAMEHDRGVNLN